MKRDSVLFYRSFSDAIKALPEDQQLDVFWALVNYGLDGIAPDSGIAAAMLTAFKPIIDKNNKKYENRVGKTKKAVETTNENKQEQTKTNEGDKGEMINDKGEMIKDIYKDISPAPYQKIISLYHQCCTTLPKVTKMTKTRQASVRKLYKEYGIDGFEDVFAKAGASDFLSGRTGKWNGCCFDWLIKPANFIKVLEGNYDNAKKAKKFKNASERSYDMDALELKLLASN